MLRSRPKTYPVHWNFALFPTENGSERAFSDLGLVYKNLKKPPNKASMVVILPILSHGGRHEKDLDHLRNGFFDYLRVHGLFGSQRGQPAK